MKLESLLNHSVELVKILLKSSISPEALIFEYFRKKKYIGSKERKIITEIVFNHLRFLKFSEYVFKSVSREEQNELLPSESIRINILLSLYIVINIYPMNLTLATKSIEKLFLIDNGFEYLQKKVIDLLIQNFNLGKIKNTINRIESLDTSKENIENELMNLSARYSIPEFILDSWYSFYTKIQIDPIEIAESLLFPASLIIRINSKSITRELVKQKFQEENYECSFTNFSPFGLAFKERANIISHPYYNQGLIEIQDEGSQLVCLACNPQKEDKILDACAGAGGKSIFLAFLQEDSGEIIANDINLLKLKELRKRAIRSGFTSIRTNLFHPKENRKNILKENYFDIVLVDAPCSGIGTARRNPMHKWWLNPNKLSRLAKTQFELLGFYSRYVKYGGYLIYSTCSLMPEENQMVTGKFLKQNSEFIPYPLFDAFQNFSIDLPMLDKNTNQINLFPHIHGTDGFYIAKFYKRPVLSRNFNTKVK